MKQLRSKILIILAVVALVGFGCETTSNDERRITNNDNFVETRHGASPWGEVDHKGVITTRFVEKVGFENTEVVEVKNVDGYLVAGIVNHHSLAMDIQSRFFKSLKESRPDVEKFIVISPDHFLAGDLISTHSFVYATPAGEVESEALGEEDVFEVEDVNIFSNEHGIGAVVPFIAREFPEAKVIPIYIRPEATRIQLQNLGESIAKRVDEKTFVVVSSDMSHYLKDEEARENDRLTLKWIEDQEWQKLQSANDDYTDSAQSFVMLEEMFETLKHQVEFELLDYAVSTDYGADPNETTSYINGFYFIAESR